MATRGKRKHNKNMPPRLPAAVRHQEPIVLLIANNIHLGRRPIPSRPVFMASMLLMSIFLILGSLRLGVPADAPIDYAYGKASLHYFETFGADTGYRALKVNGIRFPDQKYYGAAFEMAAPVINHFFKPSNPYAVHNLLCALAGILLLLFTGLIAKSLQGWTAGLLAIWLLFLTPVVSGNAFFNSKDIPFAAAFAAGMYYLLLLLHSGPAIRRPVAAGIILAVAAAVSIRISGLLLPAYILFFALAWWFLLPGAERAAFLKRNFKALLWMSAAGTLLGLLTYPNFWHAGLAHITGGLAATRKFPHNIFMLYNDQLISSQKTDTVSYLFRLLIMTVPELILFGFVYGIAVLVIRKQSFNKAYSFMLFFAAVFPFAYVMVLKAPVYNGWRHLLFAYPFVVVVVAQAFTATFYFLKNKIAVYAFAVLLLLALSDLLIWQVQAFPYNYVYFNHLSGGLPGAYRHYDTDYQQLATYEGVEWIREQEDPLSGTLNIMSNNANALREAYDSSKVKFDYVSIKDMWLTDWDYAVVSTVFLNAKAIAAMFPPFGTVHTVERFGVPLAFVVKRQNRDDLTIYRMMHADSLAAAAGLIDKVYDSNKTNVMAWYWKACVLYLNDDYAASLKLLDAYDQLFPLQDYIYELKGYNYYSMDDYQQALKYLGFVYKKQPDMKMYNRMIGDCLTALGQPEQAKYYYDKLK